MVAPLVLMGLGVAAKLAGTVAGAIGDSGASQAAAKAVAAKAKSNAATRRTADDFETMFLENTLDRLTQGTGEDGPLGAAGQGGAVYRSMLVKEYAGKLQKSGGVGIADQVYRQMLQMQESTRAAG